MVPAILASKHNRSVQSPSLTVNDSENSRGDGVCHPPAVQAFPLGSDSANAAPSRAGVKGFALATRAHPAALLDNVEDLEAGTASLRLHGALPHTPIQPSFSAKSSARGW